MRKGMIHVYTGNGKGKTTAAAGLAVRARARGLRVALISFHKQPEIYNGGEYNALRTLGVLVEHAACAHPECPGATNAAVDAAALAAECTLAVQRIRDLFQNRELDMLVLDEVIVSVRDGFLAEADLLGLMSEKPEQLELVLTGRGATPAVIAKADVVSEIREIKHPFQKGVPAREGIEY